MPYIFGQPSKLANRTDAAKQVIALPLVASAHEADALRLVLLVAIQYLPSRSLGDISNRACGAPLQRRQGRTQDTEHGCN